MFSQIPTPSIDGSIARVRRAVSYTAAATMVTVSLAGAARVGAQNAATLTNPVPARTDPYVERTRVLVMTDIANEPDDQMSMVRFLVYANQFDIEGLVATTFTWMRNRVRPDVIRTLLDAYEAVQPNLQKHQPGFPAAAALRGIVVPGQTGYGMAAVGPDKMSPGAELIIKAAERPTRGHSGSAPGEGPTRWRRRCSTSVRRAPRSSSRRSCPGFVSTRSRIRTTRDRGSGESSPNSTTSSCHRRRTETSTPSRHGLAPQLHRRRRRPSSGRCVDGGHGGPVCPL